MFQVKTENVIRFLVVTIYRLLEICFPRFSFGIQEYCSFDRDRNIDRLNGTGSNDYCKNKVFQAHKNINFFINKVYKLLSQC